MSNTKKILVISFLVTLLLVIIVTGILVFAIPKKEKLSKNTSSTDGIKTTVSTTVTTTSTTGMYNYSLNFKILIKIKSQYQKL